LTGFLISDSILVGPKKHVIYVDDKR